MKDQLVKEHSNIIFLNFNPLVPKQTSYFTTYTIANQEQHK